MISRIARSSAGGTRPRITSARPSRTETQKISPERIAKNTTRTTTPTTIHGVINVIIPVRTGRAKRGRARLGQLSSGRASGARCRRWRRRRRTAVETPPRWLDPAHPQASHVHAWGRKVA
jgi:hypothetical protein